MSSMFIYAFGVCQDVIYKHHQKLVLIGSENSIHEIHKSCWGIGLAKRHNCKLIMTIPSSKHSLGDVLWFNPKLMIS